MGGEFIIYAAIGIWNVALIVATRLLLIAADATDPAKHVLLSQLVPTMPIDRSSDDFTVYRKLMDAWAEYCAEPSAKPGDFVVPIAARKR